MSEDTLRCTDETFAFLADLRENNDRDWFAAHRKTWHRAVRDPFGQVLREVSERLAGGPLPLRGGPETLFRINRDVRFSKDKRPYNTSVSGLLTLTGTKAEAGPLAYVELGAEGGRVGGGLHRPNAKALAPVRRRLIDEPEAFDAVLDALARVHMEVSTERQVKTMPRGFAAHREHRHAAFVRSQDFVAMCALPESAWRSGEVVQQIANVVQQGLVPLYRFLDGR